MAHTVYQSTAFVLGGTNVGDANRYIDLFTRDIGFVRAVAQSVRREKSKLRYSLQPYTFGKVSLVRGRDIWRLTGAMEDFNAYHTLKTDKEKLVLLYNVATLLKRLLQGEGQNEYLFDTFSSFVKELHVTTADTKELKAMEYLTVLRILYSLGYVEKRDGLYDSHDYDTAYLQFVREQEKEILHEINRALEQSHL